ncbi:MAG: InlB B-repeat-containing protein [Clostridia bacterium]|nr:InlB B-repeat-containing protein [Clostridia bacterium]
MKKVILLICSLFLLFASFVGCNNTTGACEHDYLHISKIEATCQNQGVIEHYKCSKCQKLFDLNKREINSVVAEINPENHSKEEYLAVKTQPQKLLYNAGETFESTGLSIVKKCDDCKGQTVDNELIAFSYQNSGADCFLEGDTKIIATVGELSLEITISLTAVYTVTFDTQGGTQINAVQVAEGGKLPQIETPVKSDDKGEYEFVCWLLNGEEWDEETDVVTGDITLVAKWKVVSSYTPPYVPND